MRVNTFPIRYTITRTETANTSRNDFLSMNYKQMTNLSPYPMGYTQISFKGNLNVVPKHENGSTKNEKEFSLEDRVKIQSRYLWGINWNEQEA